MCPEILAQCPFKDGADCAPVSPSATLAESWSAPVPRLHLSQLSSSATVQPGTVQLSGTAPRLQVQNLQLKKRKTLWASVETRVWYNRVLNPKMWIVWPILPFSALYPLSSWPHSRHVTQPQHPLWQPCLTFILHFHSKWKENRGHTICTRIFNI